MAADREGKGKRRDGLIVLMNELHLPSHIWYFRRGLPYKYSGPSMNASQSGCDQSMSETCSGPSLPL